MRYSDVLWSTKGTTGHKRSCGHPLQPKLTLVVTTHDLPLGTARSLRESEVDCTPFPHYKANSLRLSTHKPLHTLCNTYAPTTYTHNMKIPMAMGEWRSSRSWTHWMLKLQTCIQAAQSIWSLSARTKQNKYAHDFERHTCTWCVRLTGWARWPI